MYDCKSKRLCDNNKEMRNSLVLKNISNHMRFSIGVDGYQSSTNFLEGKISVGKKRPFFVGTNSAKKEPLFKRIKNSE